MPWASVAVRGALAGLHLALLAAACTPHGPATARLLVRMCMPRPPPRHARTRTHARLHAWAFPVACGRILEGLLMPRPELEKQMTALGLERRCLRGRGTRNACAAHYACGGLGGRSVAPRHRHVNRIGRSHLAKPAAPPLLPPAGSPPRAACRPCNGMPNAGSGSTNTYQHLPSVLCLASHAHAQNILHHLAKEARQHLACSAVALTVYGARRSTLPSRLMAATVPAGLRKGKWPG